MRIRTTRNTILGVVATALIACSEPANMQVDEDGHAHGEDTHEHGGEAGQSLVYTHYTDLTELFVEFPPLVVGEPSQFAAHLTTLDDHEPLLSGVVYVALEQNGSTVARFRVREPSRDGLFIPTVSPRAPGDFDLVIEVTGEFGSSRHELGQITVFSSIDEVVINQEAPDGDIVYLKEQQWTAPFATEQANIRNLSESWPAFATITAPPGSTAVVHAPLNASIAAQSLVSSGQFVEAGQVMARLLPRTATSADINALSTQLEQLRGRVNLGQADVTRVRDLVASGALPQRRLDIAETELSEVQSELRLVETRLNQVRTTNTDQGVELRAPISGVVAMANALPGAYITQGAELFKIIGHGQRWLQVDLSEHFAALANGVRGVWFSLSGGESIRLTSDTNTSIVQGITQINPQSRTATVILSLPELTGLNVVGQRLPVNVISASTRQEIAVPATSLINEDGRQVVFVQTGGESFARRNVETGIRDGDYVAITSGLTGGERVVTLGAYNIRLAAAGTSEIGHGHTH